MSGCKVAVVGASFELLAASPGTPSTVTDAFPQGVLDTAKYPRLTQALRGCLAAGTRERLDPAEHVDLLEGRWALECSPWDIPVSLPSTESSVRLSGVARRVALLTLTDDAEAQGLRLRLEQVNRAESLGMLAGSVAHDFNNLLTGIRGSLALVRHHASAEGREAALCAADAAAQRAGDMTRRLLAFTRGPDRVVGRAEPTAVLNETVGLLRCMPDSSGVQVELDAELGAVDMLPSELHQVVLNLLVNASDAVRSQGLAGGVVLRASPTWRAEPGSKHGSSHWLRITVIDQGPGMDAEVKRRIFEPFFTTKPNGMGTGLGLSSVQELVKKAGGWLEVESEIDRGSAFHVYLPLSSEPATHAAESARTAKLANQPQILICDDESRLGELTVGLLEEFGYNARAVLKGEEAVTMMSAGHPPDALLLDVNLSSGMTASEVIAEIESKNLPVPVILTSGLSAEDIPSELRHHPRVKCYLGKPYTVGELVASISTALEAEHEEPAADSQTR